MTLLHFIAAALATYRAARMVTQEDGPADAFAELRARAGQATWIGRGLHCFLCTSFWAALPIAWLLPVRSGRERLLAWGGLAGAAVLLWKYLIGLGIEGHD